MPNHYQPDLLKHNDYIKMLQVKKQMSFQQQRIFDTVLLIVQDMHRKGNLDGVVKEGTLSFDLDFFKEQMLKGSKINKINRSDIKSALEAMTDLKFSYDLQGIDDNGEETNKVGNFVIFQKAEVDFLRKKVNLTFGLDFRTENLIPNANYTALSSGYLNAFSSQYARALYQYFKMFIGKDYSRPFRDNKEDDMEFIKKLLGINETEHLAYFNNHSTLIMRTIEPAIKQINTCSDIEASFERVKKGNKIIAIRFTFKPKTEYINHHISRQSNRTGILMPTFKKFSEFKVWVIETYSGLPLVKGPVGFNEDLIVILSEKGYLHNPVTRKDFNPDDAMDLWQWMYSNKHRVGRVDLSRSEIFTDNHKGKYLKHFDKANGEYVYLKILNIHVEDRSMSWDDKVNITIEQDGQKKSIDNYYDIKKFKDALIDITEESIIIDVEPF